MNHKKMFIIKTFWYVYNPANKTYEKAEIAGNQVKIRYAMNYNWLVAGNPYPTPGREFMVAEKGTGYVLAYGPTAQYAYDKAVRRFKSESSDNIRPGDIRQLLQYHIILLKNFIPKIESDEIRPDLSGFKIELAPQSNRLSTK